MRNLLWRYVALQVRLWHLPDRVPSTLTETVSVKLKSRFSLLQQQIPTGKRKRTFNSFTIFVDRFNSEIAFYNWYRVNIYKLSDLSKAEALNVSLMTLKVLKIMCYFSPVCTQLFTIYLRGFRLPQHNLNCKKKLPEI